MTRAKTEGQEKRENEIRKTKGNLKKNERKVTGERKRQEKEKSERK